MKRNLKKGVLMLAVAATGSLLLLFNRQSAQGATDAIRLCLTSLIPSLFPFMVICLLVLLCGGGAVLGRVISPVMQLLFRQKGNAATACALSFVGGYPTGAQMIDLLVRSGELSSATAQKLLYFCVNAGPAFVLGVAGPMLFNGAQAGLMLLIAHLGGAVIIGITVMHTGSKKEPDKGQSIPKKPPAPLPFDQALVSAVARASAAMLQICAWVVLFGALSGVLTCVIVHPAWQTGLCAILEVSGGCVRIKPFGLPALAALISFAGLCVHGQIFAGVSFPVAKGRFLLARGMHALLSAGIALLLCRIFPGAVQTLQNGVRVLPGEGSSGWLASAALLLTCAVFAVSVAGKE